MDVELRDDANTVIFKLSMPASWCSEQMLRTFLWEQVQPELEKARQAATASGAAKTVRLRLVP